MPMLRRPSARFTVLLVALACLLPLVPVASACTDCLLSVSLDCCPPACCSCCANTPSVMTASLWAVPRPVPVDAAPIPLGDSYSSFRPHDIFHVPKPSLV